MAAKVYTVTPGLALDIGAYGRATNDEPCMVPEAVAAELEQSLRGTSKAIRVERDVPAARPKPSPRTPPASTADKKEE